MQRVIVFFLSLAIAFAAIGHETELEEQRDSQHIPESAASQRNSEPFAAPEQFSSHPTVPLSLQISEALISLFTQALSSLRLSAELLSSDTVSAEWALNSFLSLLQAEEPDPEIAALLKNFLVGLEVNSQNTGPCYAALEPAVDPVTRVIEDFYQAAQGSLSGIIASAADVRETVEVLQSVNVTECKFPALAEKLATATKESIYAGCTKHALVCTQDLVTLKQCKADFSKCGLAAGRLLRFVIGWELD